MNFKENTDRVWLRESVGNLKGVGQLAIAKMNELSIHRIADLHLHVHHRGKVPILGFDRIYAMDLQALWETLLLLSSTTGKRKIRIFQDMDRYGWTN